MFEDVRKVFFPLLWVEQNVDVPSSVVLLLKLFLNAPYILTGVAVVLIGAGLYLLICKAFKSVFIRACKSMYRRKECKWTPQHQLYSLK